MDKKNASLKVFVTKEESSFNCNKVQAMLNLQNCFCYKMATCTTHQAVNIFCSFFILVFLACIPAGCTTTNGRASGQELFVEILGCNEVGKAAEKMIGPERIKEIRAASTVTCMVVAHQMRSQRAKALAREREIDTLIEKEKMRIHQLTKRNNELKNEIKSIERQTNALEIAIKVDKSRAYKMAALLQNQKNTIPERLEIIENAIAKAEIKLKGSSSTPYQREILPDLISRLKDRKKILENTLNRG